MSTAARLREAFNDVVLTFPEADPATLRSARIHIENSPDFGLYFLLNLITQGGRYMDGRALGEPGDYSPITPLGKLALSYDQQAMQQSNAVINFASFTCDEAEARFVQSIHRVSLKSPSAVSSIIYLDEDEPIAYRKHTGDPTLLLLHETNKLLGVPAGTCLRVNRRTLKDKELPTKNPSLTAAPFEIPATTRVQVLRPLTFTLEPDYVTSLGYNPKPAIERDIDEPVFGATALTTDLDLIRSRLDMILEDAKL